MKVEEMAVERRVDAPMIGEVRLNSRRRGVCDSGWSTQMVRPTVAVVDARGRRVVRAYQAEKNGARVVREKVTLEAAGEEARCVLAGKPVVVLSVVRGSKNCSNRLLLRGCVRKGSLIELTFETTEDTMKCQ